MTNPTDMSPAAPSASAIEMNELVLPQHTNTLRSAFGGVVMSWIDICAALTAQRHSRSVVVTASMDQLDFLAPIKEGALVTLKGMVNYVGRTSLEVGVRVETENTLTGVRQHAASAYVTFVAIDRDGQPIPVRPLLLETEEERVRNREAIDRRKSRLGLAERRRLLHATRQTAETE